MNAPRTKPQADHLTVFRGYLCTCLADGSVPLNSRAIAKIDAPDEIAAVLAVCSEFRDLRAENRRLREALERLYAAFPDCDGGEQGKACKQARQALKGK